MNHRLEENHERSFHASIGAKGGGAHWNGAETVGVFIVRHS